MIKCKKRGDGSTYILYIPPFPTQHIIDVSYPDFINADSEQLGVVVVMRKGYSESHVIR